MLTRAGRFFLCYTSVMTYNTEGIILRYRDIGEYDRIYSILTSDHGKVEAWAQGVRKPQSKLVAHLQPLYLCDLMFARGRRFDRVAQVRVANRFPQLWADLEKLSKGVYAASLADIILRPGTRERSVFELLLSTLTLLEKGDGALELIFSIKLLRESGFSPELKNCVLCKKEAVGLGRYFDAIRGGVLCNDCVTRHPEASAEGSRTFLEARDSSLPTVAQNDNAPTFQVSSLTLETMETILNSPLASLELPETVRQELQHIADAMIEMHFGQESKARYFMDYFAKEFHMPASV